MSGGQVMEDSSDWSVFSCSDGVVGLRRWELGGIKARSGFVFSERICGFEGIATARFLVGFDVFRRIRIIGILVVWRVTIDAAKEWLRVHFQSCRFCLSFSNG